MSEELVSKAVQTVLNGRQTFIKYLSANDTGATGGHQAGILVSKTAKEIMFSQSLDTVGILKREIQIEWQNSIRTNSIFTYYRSKNELRITQFGRGFPLLKPEQTGALFVFIKQDEDYYNGYLLETDDDIESFIGVLNISPTQSNCLISTSQILPEEKEKIEFRTYIDTLHIDFPTSAEMSSAARMIQNKIYNHVEHTITEPDRKIIEWTNMEYSLFKALEYSRYKDIILNGFHTVDDFITMANIVLNRRKSRAGKSLEHHLSAIFDGNMISYTSQAVTEANKKPDFIFPSQDAYHDPSYPRNRIVMLAAKTTCKDRWRQILNEADQLRDRVKYLFTLQQGISPAQMDEMQMEKIILVVPKPYIASYPKDRQSRIWTLSRFIGHICELEGVL